MTNNNLLPKVFAWMCGGLLLTFLTGIVLAMQPLVVENLLTSLNGFGFIIIIIIELALVIFLSARITKMSPLTAKLAFLIYSFVSGITFSTIFLTYNLASIFVIFLISAVLFGLFALIGFVTKKDLSGLGNFLFMALIGVIICIIVNLFLHNSTFDLIISIVTVLVFIGFTAYDMQKIKSLEYSGLEEDNLAIYGALSLYLDFINIFIQLLSIFGERK